MTDTPRRVFGVLCVMVVIWIATYWLYEPAAWEPRVTFGEAPAELVIPETPLPAPDPLAPPITLAPPRPEPPAAAAEPPRQPETVVRRRVEPPAFREYTVQSGDTGFESIAQKELGDRRLWRAIANANPFVTPDKLRPGRTVLKIPLDPQNIQGRVVEEVVPVSPPAQDATPQAPKPPPPPPPAVEYTISSGDTLSGIAKQFYNDPNLWRLIYEANRGVLKDPDQLPRGAKIEIPPRPARRAD